MKVFISYGISIHEYSIEGLIRNVVAFFCYNLISICILVPDLVEYGSTSPPSEDILIRPSSFSILTLPKSSERLQYLLIKKDIGRALCVTFSLYYYYLY